MLGAGAEECKGIDCPAALGDRNRLQALVAGGTVGLHGTEPRIEDSIVQGDAAGVRVVRHRRGDEWCEYCCDRRQGCGRSGPHHRDRPRHQVVYRLHRRRRRRLLHRTGRVLRHARSIRLRQDHHPAHDRRVRDPTSGAIRLDGEDVSRTPAQAQRQHGVPALRPLPSHDGVEQRGLRAPLKSGTPPRSARRSTPLSRWCASASSPSASPRSSPVASNSGWPWPVRW